MNCPLCGSEISNGVKYCPVCGADIEAAQRRSSGVQQPDITRRMPPLQDQSAPNPRRAVPFNSSMPPQQHSAMRNFDTSKMGGAPKWPIVLIVLLALVIVVAVVLIIFRPWESSSGSTTVTGSPTVSQTTDATTATDGTDATAEGVAETTEGTEATEPTTTEATATGALSEEEAYAQLLAHYEQLGSFDERISAVASDFNANYLSSDLSVRQASLATASALQSEISTQSAALAALVLADGSAYTDTKNTLQELYNDLANRIRVLVEAWQASVDAGDTPNNAAETISSILSADNLSNGVNQYKSDFDTRYPSSAPVQVS